VIKFFEGQKVRILFIPLLKRDTAAATPGPRTFTVELRKTTDGPALGPLSRVTVTIEPVTSSRTKPLHDADDQQLIGDELQ